jgi:hypothetical protein
VQQKDGIAVKTEISWRNKRRASGRKQKYRGASKDEHRVKNGNIVAARTFFTPILKATR